MSSSGIYAVNFPLIYYGIVVVLDVEINQVGEMVMIELIIQWVQVICTFLTAK